MKKFVLLLILFLFSCSKEPLPSYKNIELKDWDNQTRKIEDFKGKILIIDVWASWCEPCKYSTPVFEELMDRFKKENVVFYGLNSDTELSIPEIKAAAKEFGMTYPSILDPEFKLINELEMRGQPAIFIFGKESEIKYFQYGINESDLDDLTNKIKSFL